jgi:hypothetical protein
MRDVKPRVVIVGGGAGGAELASVGPSITKEWVERVSGVLRQATFDCPAPSVDVQRVSLKIMHHATLIGWWRAVTLMVADGLQRTVAPPVKLH